MRVVNQTSPHVAAVASVALGAVGGPRRYQWTCTCGAVGPRLWSRQEAAEFAGGLHAAAANDADQTGA